jgi:hypothetical protein
LPVRPTRTPRPHRLLIALLAAVTGLGTLALPVRAAPITYYVDCTAGSDTATGRSTTTAWRSISKANSAPLVAGDKLLFKRGCSWAGPLSAKWIGTASTPITIGAYGSGALPRIDNATTNIVVTGSYLILENLATRTNPPSYDSGCKNQPMGMTKGFRLHSGATYNTVRQSEVSGFNVGIWIDAGSHHNKVLSNVVRDNNVKDSDPNSDGGAVGIGLLGDSNEVAYNTITGSYACSRQHGQDGGAIEIYGGKSNSIHHNTARQNHGFVEVGNSRSADNTLAYNVVTSTLTKSSFAVARGASDSWGPTYRTKLYNNSVYLTGTESFAVQCYGGCNSTVMTFRNNIVWAQDRVGYVDSGWAESNNIWWSPGGPKIWFTKSSTSKTVDPKFVNPGAGDLHIASGSPAIDAGSNESANAGYRTDIDGSAVPIGPAVDIGADERGSTTTTPTPTPTPTPNATPTPTPKPTPTPTPAPPATSTIARDAFQRSVTDAWGSAATGGGWTTSSGPASDFDVNGVEATARVASPGQMRLGMLTGVSARDIDARLRVKTNVSASGDGQYAYLVGRHLGGDTEYRAKIHMRPNGATYLQITKVIRNVETSISSYVSLGTIHAPNGFIWIRFRVTGASPTSLSAKAWKEGSSEPSGWQATGSDTSSALQQGGALGVRAWVSGDASGATVFAVDDLTVTAP